MLNILVIGVVTLIASIIGTVTGFGIATTMFPVLILFLPTEKALLFVTIIHWFNGVWKLLLFKKGIDRSLIIFFGIPSMAASIVGGLLIQVLPIFVFHRLLGFFLILYVLLLWLNPGFEISPSRFNASIGGILSGFSAGLFGIRGALTSSFLVAYNLSIDIYLATMGAIALMVDSARFITYLAIGTRLSLPLMVGLVVFIPLSFLGAYAGSLLVEKIPQTQFRTIVVLFIGIIGLKLLLGW